MERTSNSGGGAMSDPLTPPRDDPNPGYDSPNALNSVAEGDQASLHLTSSLPTPVSQMDMELDDGGDLKVATEEGSESHEMSYDEDSEMSDGGVPLTTTSSHDEHLNAELDEIDAEIMGTENLQEMVVDPNLQSTVHTHIMPFHYNQHSEPYLVQDYPPADEEMLSSATQIASDLSNLPAAMSQVSAQLQHIQDGQAHGDFVNGQEEPQFLGQHENSTEPFSSPLISHVGVENEETPLPSLILMGDISALNSPAVTVGSTNAPHLWGAEGSTPSPAMDLLHSSHDHPSQNHALLFSSQAAMGDDDASEADEIEVDEQFNLSLYDFLHRWGMSVLPNGNSKRLSRGPHLASVREQSNKNIQSISMSDLNGEHCDIQGINWDDLGVSRLAARQMRRQTYRNYTNLRITLERHPRLHGAKLSDHESFFRFRRIDFKHDIHLAHFQLRNLMASPSRGNVFYAGRSQVLRVNQAGEKSIAMDLTDPIVQPLNAFPNGIQISTLTTAHDVLVAGGFCGEYGLANLRAAELAKHSEGLITDHHNSITNHIEVHLSRNSSLPLAAFASNDNGLRVLDISTNKFIKEQKFDYAINCSSISPDQRLRVLVGDTRRVMICNAETGEILQELDGHCDFGFACDWADDGWTVATGNQDMQVKIWDARKWTNSWGESKPVASIAAEMAGVRKLKFSPLGSGKRILVAAEPADFISVIDAENFTSKQTLSFFGEIGGVDFTNNGQDLIVANCDGMRGGIMEFERCNLSSEALYGLEDPIFTEKDRPSRRKHRGENDSGLDWKTTEEEILYHPQSQRTATHRRRKAVNLGSMGPF